jgi:hypothetical protein
MPSVLTFHAYLTRPQGDRVLVAVTEGRTAAGEFEVTAAAWERHWRTLYLLGAPVTVIVALDGPLPPELASQPTSSWLLAPPC